MAALRETPVAMERVDVCLACWEGFDKTGLLGFWQNTLLPPTARRNVFVDDDVLCELFEERMCTRSGLRNSPSSRTPLRIR